VTLTVAKKAAAKTGKPPDVGKAQHPEIKKVRSQLMAEMSIKGVTLENIGKHFNVSTGRVSQLIKHASEQGWIDEVRSKMQMELIPAAMGVYKEILETHPATLADKSVQKGYALKLTAAKQANEGLGAFRRSSDTTATFKTKAENLDLEGYYQMRAERLSREQLTSEGVSHAEIVEADFVNARALPPAHSNVLNADVLGDDRLHRDLRLHPEPAPVAGVGGSPDDGGTDLDREIRRRAAVQDRDVREQEDV
jgi:hypothetical protein